MWQINVIGSRVYVYEINVKNDDMYRMIELFRHSIEKVQKAEYSEELSCFYERSSLFLIFVPYRQDIPLQYSFEVKDKFKLFFRRQYIN